MSEIGAGKSERYATMLYNQRHLIIKSVEGMEAVMIAECYLADHAQLICELLEKNEPEEK